jgi:dihydroflavonol-4-reductase
VVLVTGADGLLGSHVTRKLLDGGFTVRVLVQPGSKSPTLEGIPVERVTGDILSRESIEDAVKGCGHVFHCAAITDIWADKCLTWRVNFDGTRNVLDACVREGVGRLVFIGSASSFRFGSLENPGDESGSFPEAYRGQAYSESKHKAMELVKEYINDKGLDAVVVAPTFMIGSYDYRPSGGELIMQFIKRGMKYVSRGGRNFINARDAADAAVKVLERGRTGEVYIAGNENLTYFDFFSRVAEIAGTKPPRRVLPNAVVLAAGAAGSAYRAVSRRLALIDLRIARLSLCMTYYDPGKAISELGMETTPVETAIEESVESLKQYGHL